MKKILKNPIFMFILGAIIFSSVTVIASSLSAKDITYKENKTVENALDELYIAANKEILNSLTITLKSESYSTRYSNAILNISTSSFNNYKYFKINSITSEAATGNTVAMCKSFAWALDKGSEIELETNKQYEVYSLTDGNKFYTIYSRAQSSNEGSRAGCSVNITFYNEI